MANLLYLPLIQKLTIFQIQSEIHLLADRQSEALTSNEFK